MKRHYVKVLSVASIVAGLCAANATFADTMGVTPPGPITKGPENVQSDYNEDSGRYINSPQNPAMNPNFNLVSEVNKVDIDFMLTVAARYSLFDQTRNQNFDFLNQFALFGVHMFKNGWSADFLVRFAGNPLRSSNTNPGSTYYPFAPIDTVGSVGIRKASVAYRFWHNDKHLLKFSLGRFAPYGATAYDDDNIVRAWGTDATVNFWGPNGSGYLHGTYVDGALLSYQGKWEHSRVNAGVSVASDLPVFLYLLDGTGLFNIHQNPYQVFGNDSSFGFLSTNASRAWLGDFAYIYSGHWGDVQAAIDVGGKTKAETSFAGATAYARNMWYIAGSLGYTKDDSIGMGVWYNWVKVNGGLNGTIMTPDNAVITYVAGVAPPASGQEGNYSVFGIGLNGTSKLWKKSHLLGKGGVFTFGGGYQRFMTRSGFNSILINSGAIENTDVNLYSLAAGYSRGPVSVELDWALFTSQSNIFYRGNIHAANAANVVYIVSTFDI